MATNPLLFVTRLGLPLTVGKETVAPDISFLVTQSLTVAFKTDVTGLELSSERHVGVGFPSGGRSMYWGSAM